MPFPTTYKARANRRAEISLAAARVAMRNNTTIACGEDGRHGDCKAGPEQCLCSCHDGGTDG